MKFLLKAKGDRADQWLPEATSREIDCKEITEVFQNWIKVVDAQLYNFLKLIRLKF